jgi:hypothetical protein
MIVLFYIEEQSEFFKPLVNQRVEPGANIVKHRRTLFSYTNWF